MVSRLQRLVSQVL